MTIPTHQDGLRVAKELKSLLEKRYPKHVKGVVLYGSVVRGQADEWSDIDLAVISDPFDRSKIKEVGQFYAVSMDLDPRVSITILRPQELDDPYSSIACAVREEGVEV